MSRREWQGGVELLERRLLDAARRERPRPAARHRTVLALAGGAALSGAATSAAALGIAKAVVVGAISGIVVLGAAQKLELPPEPRAASTSSPSVEIGRNRPASPEVRAAKSPPLEQLVEPAPRPSQEAVSFNVHSMKLALPPPRPSASAASTAPPPARSPSSLTAEVAALDRAREAVLARDPDGALRALDAYERSGTDATLAAEATLLRIQALLQEGERSKAASLADAFLREHPQSPVADRMRAVTDDSSR